MSRINLFTKIVGFACIGSFVIAALVYFGWTPIERIMNQNQKNYNVKSYNQYGGITAGEVNVGLPGRHVTEQVKKELDRSLLSDKNKKIIVLCAADDYETQNFAYEIKTYLESQGYMIQGFGKVMASSKPQKGVGIIDRKDGGIDLVVGGR
jgi:hypothetical protein